MDAWRSPLKRNAEERAVVGAYTSTRHEQELEPQGETNECGVVGNDGTVANNSHSKLLSNV